jgi:photosystem II stability/assembly factor-like uncharacterized protein
MSTDGGAVWTQIDSWLGEGGSCIVLPQNDSLILYGGQGNSTSSNWAFGICRSTNGGMSWARTWIQQTVAGYCRTLAVAPSAPERIYAGGCISGAGAIAVSTDRGGTWTQTVAAPAETVFGLAVHPTDPAGVFAATVGGVYRTTDAGATWQRVWNGQGLRSIVFSPGSAETLLVAGDAGVWLSPDASASWQEMNDGLAVRAVKCLAWGGPGGERLFAGTAGGAVYEYSFLTGTEERRARDVARVTSVPTVVRGVLEISPQLAASSSQLGIYDINGRKVMGVPPSALRTPRSVDVGHLTPGVYFVRGETTGRQPVLKVIVQ